MTVRRTFGRLRTAMMQRWARPDALRRLAKRDASRPHDLPGELIVSLTSYPARFGTLNLTLACLLDQSVEPDRVILWIAHQDIEHLPAEVRRLEERGLEIRTCDDLRSFKKLIPALEAFPNAFIVTADDDLFFSRHWLEALVNGALDTRGVITCQRVHRPKGDVTGRLVPYRDWRFDVRDQRAREPSSDLMPTGGAGALYPPQSFDRRVTDRTLFERLCPDGDDLWFFWCARLAGTLHKKVGPKMWLITWAASQRSSLWATNEAGGNDRMIRALEEEFGYLDRSSG